MAAWASIIRVDTSATKVGTTIYLLSEAGKDNAKNVSMGGTTTPNMPSLGSVCLEVGELNLNLFKADMHEKNIKFFMFI